MKRFSPADVPHESLHNLTRYNDPEPEKLLGTGPPSSQISIKLGENTCAPKF